MKIRIFKIIVVFLELLFWNFMFYKILVEKIELNNLLEFKTILVKKKLSLTKIFEILWDSMLTCLKSYALP